MSLTVDSTFESSSVLPLVLAVDDNEDNLVLIAFTLELFGYRYITAINGQTALAAAQNEQPDLILLDIMLPDLDGIEIIRRLKQNPKTQSIPIVAVTALARREDRERLIRAGCDGYISKPYIVDENQSMLNSFWDRY